MEVPAVLSFGFRFVMQLVSGALALTLAAAGDAGGVAWRTQAGALAPGMA